MELESTYTNPELPGSFGGIDALHRATDKKFSRKEIKKWLESKDSYTLHKPVRKNFRKNRVLVGGINQQFQADLVDMQSLAQFNDSNKYLLTCIDILSKYAWVTPLKDKTASNVLKAFKQIFSERIPKTLQTDSGKEFTNKLFQSYLKKMGIKFFMTNNNTKASVVERFNRTFKTKMWKYVTEKNTKRYIDVLNKLIYSYNHTWHRSIKKEPAFVNENNEKQIWNNLYGKQMKIQEKEVFKIGDTVRINREKFTFEKGYEKNWTIEIFTVSEIIHRTPIVYKLKDLSGEIIKGSFYKEELQKVKDSGYYPVEKVLKTRKKYGRKEYFVKFQGYPDKFNAWVRDVKMI